MKLLIVHWVKLLWLLPFLSLLWPSSPGPLLLGPSLALPLILMVKPRRWSRLVGIALLCFLLRALVYESLDVLALALGPLALAGYGVVRLWVHTRRDWQDSRALYVYGYSALAWVGLQLCMPPLPLGPWVFVVLVPWFFALQKAPRGMALRASFWVNLPAQCIGYYWVANVVQAGYALAIGGGLLLLLAFLSFFPVLLAWIYLQLRGPWRWCFPLLAGGLEILRARGEISFPWGPIAASLGNQLEFLQWTSVIGGVGLGVLIYAMNQWIYESWQKGARLSLAFWLALPLALWFGGSHMLHSPQFKGESFKVLLIQPNQDQKLKWDKAYFEDLMNQTWTLIQSAPAKGHDLIVLPETSIPNFVTMADPWPEKFANWSKSIGIPMVFGVLDYEYDEKEAHSARFYNTALYVDPQSPDWHFYRKVRLVPFSEALPFGKILPMINFVDLGEGDFSPGAGPEVLHTGGKAWSPNLCYEIVYGDFVRQQVKLGSKVMVEMTNDGWFGRSSQPWQHLNLVRLRAVENGIPVVRATNTGVTAAIDAQGRIVSQIEPHQASYLSVEVPGSNPSFFARYGDWIEDLLLLGFGFSCLGFALRRVFSMRSQIRKIRPF